jgi:ubiquinone/menaquinone biosynthesis C-methylase UbiE
MTKSTSDTQKQYNRIASIYDILDAIPERLFYRSWRRQLWEKVTAGRILEIGVGTGKNMYFYPPGAQVTAIDISSKMLEKATVKTAGRSDIVIELLTMDVSELTLEAALFDAVVGSFILMVVPHPLKALQEIKRVCKPDGKLFLLEFTRSDNQLVAFLQDLVTPFTHTVYHAHVNRDIAMLVQGSGFRIVNIEEVRDGIIKIIQAVSSEN